MYKRPWRSGLKMDAQTMSVFHSLSLTNGVDIQTFVQETCVFCVDICSSLGLVQDRIFATGCTAAQIRAPYVQRIISTGSLILGNSIQTSVRRVCSIAREALRPWSCSNCEHHCSPI